MDKFDETSPPPTIWEIEQILSHRQIEELSHPLLSTLTSRISTTLQKICFLEDVSGFKSVRSKPSK
jgi:hypothetical protein